MHWKNVEPMKIHRLFYPQVPVIVTAEYEGIIGGMPAIWCMPLSFNPPLVGVAIAPEHETFRIVTGAKAFGVNWVDFSYASNVGELGETSAKGLKNKLATAGFTVMKGENLATLNPRSLSSIGMSTQGNTPDRHSCVSDRGSVGGLNAR